MGREFATSSFTTRFHLFGLDAINEGGKDPVMDPAITTSEEPEQSIELGQVRPRASAWLWRPWYAKVWWACIVIYWAGKLASYWSEPLGDLYSTALAGLLNIAFFPPVAVMILGVGYAREWFASSDWEFVEPIHEEMFPQRSVGGLRDPCSDPLDPRSGSLWIGSPENQAKQFNRHWP
jgi:hypothetical protein